MKERLNDISKKYEQGLQKISDASFNVFTSHGEDGIILYLLKHTQEIPKSFIDIGSGDCINSNCAILTVHFGWTGIFIDRNKNLLLTGKRFYKKLPAVKTRNLKFIETTVTSDNVDELISSAGLKGKIGLLSVDIDGNDFWIWQSIYIVQPVIVIIESKVEFGEKNIIVPNSNTNHHSFDAMYNGASIEALRRLGEKKGYRLVGANSYGYNLFFVDEKYASELPAITTTELLLHPETIKSLYPDTFFADKKFEAGI